MTIWTPARFIRAKVLGLAWRRDVLLLAEVEDSMGRVKGLRVDQGGRCRCDYAWRFPDRLI